MANSSNPSQHNPPVPSISMSTQPKDTSALVCFHCGQPGHAHPECLKCFDVRYMDLKERQGFAQEEFVALDVREMMKLDEEAQEEVKEDFGPDNE